MTAVDRLPLTLFLCCCALLALAATTTLGRPARLAPLWVILPTTALLLVQLGIDLRAALRAGRAAPADQGAGRREIQGIAWLVGLTLGVLALGLALAVPAFVALHLRYHAREPWWRALAAAALALAVIVAGLSYGFGIVLPEGWIGLRLGR